MGKGYSNLFTGALFTAIDINIGVFDIIPDFIGYIIMLNGLSMLYKETSIREFRIANYIGVLLLTESVVNIFFPIKISLQNLSDILVISMVISKLIYLFFVYFIYSASIELLEQRNEFEFKERIEIARNTYVYTLMIITVVQTFIPNIDVDIRSMVLLITTIVGFIILIIFLSNLNKLKKHFYTAI